MTPEGSWIPLTERLPDVGELVVLRNENRGPIVLGSLFRHKGISKKYVWHVHRVARSFSDYTHFYPLPKQKPQVIEMPKLGPWQGPITIDRKAA